MKESIRIVISKKPDVLINTSELIIARHVADSTTSVLNIMDMAGMTSITTFARTKHNEAGQLNRDKEIAYQARDNALGTGELDGALEGGLLVYRPGVDQLEFVQVGYQR